MKTVKIDVAKPFPFSPNGYDVVQIEAGVHDVSAECAKVAVKEGWATRVRGRRDDAEKAAAAEQAAAEKEAAEKAAAEAEDKAK